MAEMVPVRVRDCACPDGPHSDPDKGPGDFVYLIAKPGLDMGLAYAQIAGSDEDTLAKTIAAMVAFVRYGAKGANFLDPFDVQELLTDNDLGRPVALAATELYAEAVMRPLTVGPSNRATRRSSRNGQKASSTSRARVSRTPSRVSSSDTSSAGAP